MQLEWEGKIGPASIVGIVGALSVLVTIGIMWGQQQSKTEAAALAAADAKAAIVEQARRAVRRDEIVSEHSVALGRIETQLGVVNPALQRIEQKLNAPTPKP